MQFHIESMTCGGCAKGVVKAIAQVDPQAKVITDPPTRKVEIISSLPRTAFEAALADAGFPVTAN